MISEKCRKLEIENKEVKSQYEELNIQMKNKLELQKIEFLQKIEEHLNISNLEMTNLKNQIESNKICYESKEKALCNELQVVQAASAIQYDELESNLKRQLVDANSKLRHAQNIIRTLQLELNHSRSQQQKYKTQTNDFLHFQTTPIQIIKNNTGYFRQPANLDYLQNENIEINDHNETFIDGQQSIRQQSDMHLETTHSKSTPDRPLSRTTECSSVRKIVQDFNQNNQHNSGDEISHGISSTSSAISKIKQNETKITSDRSGKSCQIKSKSIQNEKNYFRSELCDKERNGDCDNVPVIKHKYQTQIQLDGVMKYSPLPFSASSSFEESGIYEEDQRNKLQSYVPVLYRGSSSSHYSNAPRKKNNIPPLMPCSDTNKGKRKQQRKRKLYNPDESVYLEEVADK